VADPLLHYIQNPLSSTVLVFCIKYKTLDKRSKFYKSLDKHAVIFESRKIYDNKIPEWVNSYLHTKGFKIKPQATQLIGEYLGNDLSRVANECDKLLLNIPKGQEIDVLNIEEHIGISKEFNVFELNTAIAKKQALKAFRIAAYFKSNPKNNPLVVTLGSLYTFFSKVLLYHSLPDKSRMKAAAVLGVHHFFMTEYEVAATNYPPAKAAAVIGLLRKYDLKSKGIENANTDDGELLRELIYKILH
jgi:DNA polymerase-3 subunit delta